MSEYTVPVSVNVQMTDPIADPQPPYDDKIEEDGKTGYLRRWTGSNGHQYESCNWLDANGNPAGGYIKGLGMEIHFQDGPLGRGAERRPANGAFVEDIETGLIHRMEFYQRTRFACRENALVITKLEEAQHWGQHRTRQREARGVEGLNVV